jgi:SAM-dependent methyltransferase
MNGAMHELLRPDRFPRASRYDPEWVLSLDMGPHPLWQLEDLLEDLRLRPGDHVLDLGCGRGATSVFLAREAGVEVVAIDRWVEESDLCDTFAAAGVADRVVALQGDVRRLPFDEAAFAAIVCIDAFEYFGTDVHVLPQLLRVLQPGGRIALSTPALSVDPYEQPPPAAVTSLVGWEAAAWHAPDWWRRHWELTGLVTEVTARLQPGSRDDWIRWARASGESDDGPLLTMLTSMGVDEIGFALVSATKRAPS